jgi:small subunit ribosomal protein S35
MAPAEREAAMLENLRSSLAELDPATVASALRKGKTGLTQTSDFGLESDEDFDIEEEDKRKTAAGFWAEGEEEMGPDEDYYGDDLTSHGHGELEQHRELREYARLIAWELPLLSRTSTPITHASTTPLLRAMRCKSVLLMHNRSRPTLHPS